MPGPSRGDSTGELFIAGRLRARLLGLPLLTIDVHVAVGPDAFPPPPIDAGRSVSIGPRTRHRVPRRLLPSRPARRPRRTGERAAVTTPASDGAGRRPRPGGGRLARSAQLVREATTVLEEVDAG